MAEQQLLDYIQKAKQAGQTDEQTRALLYKNGWTEAEVNDAFAAITQPEPQVKPQPQYQPQPQIQPKPQYKPEPIQNKMPVQKNTGRLVFTLLAVLFVLIILSGVSYVAIWQQDLVKNLFSSFWPAPAITTVAPVVNTPVQTPAPAVSSGLETSKLATILQDYDITKLTVYSFSKNGDNTAYCAPLKNSLKIDCFLNNQKLDNPYNYKPYWIGTSPSGKRIVSLYLDPITKQSFVFENAKENTRYDGTITSPKFSDDSQSFMFIVMGKDNKSFVVLNGKSGAPHDKIYGAPALSSNGKYILYGARDGQDLFWVADPIQ